jgi:hypothetical protein
VSPDKRQHRGAHPADERLFANAQIPVLRSAVADLSWLLGHGYAIKSALKLVGDQHNLTERQRVAISRAACTNAQKERRNAHRLQAQAIKGEHLIIDGFNLIITIEAALGGGVLFICRDDCIRDLSSVHGSYRSVMETERALLLIGAALKNLQPATVQWFLDSPISNSGRLAQRIKDLASAHGWPWSVEVVFNPDLALTNSNGIVVTSDSLILDGAERWVNLNEYLVGNYLQDSWTVDLKI